MFKVLLELRLGHRGWRISPGVSVDVAPAHRGPRASSTWTAPRLPSRVTPAPAASTQHAARCRQREQWRQSVSGSKAYESSLLGVTVVSEKASSEIQKQERKTGLVLVTIKNRVTRPCLSVPSVLCTVESGTWVLNY